MTGQRHLAVSYTSPDNLGRVYWRDLPGGGYVTVDVVDEPYHPAGRYVGRVTVERRVDPVRRRNSVPPVIAELRGHSAETVIHQLLLTARSNSAIGAALLHAAPVTFAR